MLEDLRSVAHVAGCKQVLRAVVAGEATCVLLAMDADEFIKAKVTEACNASGIEVRKVPSMEQLGKACGIAVGCAACAILK
jgi:large subunit ribosomal protein L7A